MTGTKPVKKAEHLADIILTRNEGMPSYALLLGAGASMHSGIKTADVMIESWRYQLYKQLNPGANYRAWVRRQSWYGSDGEYAFLFGELFDTSSQRRDYIENCMENASPNWGYVYLSSLIEEQIFNTVFTTNFDDLINEACYLFTEKVRPMVCAHDSEANSIKFTKKRPKIIKLHGDFLFDDIKNTEAETAKLTQNMEEKFRQCGQEYGLVVVGYGGRDDSIMLILETMIEDQQNFKNGIYWCFKKGIEVRDRVKRLLGKDRVFAVEIEGFDELMAMIHDKEKLNLPAVVVQPMKMAEKRSEIFCSVPDILLKDKVIRRDIERALDGLGKVSEKDIMVKAGEFDGEIPAKLKAMVLKRKGDLDTAKTFMRLAVQGDRDDDICAWEYAQILVDLKQWEELKMFVMESCLNNVNITYFLLFSEDNEMLIDTATKLIPKSNDFELRYVLLNRAIAYKRLRMKKEMIKDLSQIDTLENDEDLLAGIAALKRDSKKMYEMLDISLSKELLSLEDINVFPVFEDYRGDKDFKQYIDRKGKEGT